jgi:hypothetical protein
VRITADTELVWRLTRYGDRKPTTLRETIPMSIALDGGSSLTNAGATHFRTIYHGVRREYREAAADWHSAIDSFDQLKLSDNAERPFPAPGMILCDRDDPIATDLLVIADFNGEEPIPAPDDIQAALSRRRTVAVFHWRRYDADAAEPLNAEIRKLARTSGLRIIAPGERVRAKTVVIGDPAVLQYAIDLCPQVAFDSLVIRGDKVMPHAASEDLRYDPVEVRANLRKLFGTEGVWTLNAATDLLP